MTNTPNTHELAHRVSLLANGTRLACLSVLVRTPDGLSPSVLASLTGESLENISAHMCKLANRDIVSRIRSSSRSVYVINAKNLSAIITDLNNLLLQEPLNANSNESQTGTTEDSLFRGTGDVEDIDVNDNGEETSTSHD